MIKSRSPEARSQLSVRGGGWLVASGYRQDLTGDLTRGWKAADAAGCQRREISCGGRRDAGVAGGRRGDRRGHRGGEAGGRGFQFSGFRGTGPVASGHRQDLTGELTRGWKAADAAGSIASGVVCVRRRGQLSVASSQLSMWGRWLTGGHQGLTHRHGLTCDLTRGYKSADAAGGHLVWRCACHRDVAAEELGPGRRKMPLVQRQALLPNP